MNESQPAQRRSWRRYFQFSLRSLLLLTLIAAVVSAFVFRPKLHESTLGGGVLIVRSQMYQPEDKPDDPDATVPHGRWELWDRHGHRLVVGQHLKNVPHGVWTYYDTQGRKISSGPVREGVCVDDWTAWHDGRTRRAEVTYVVGEAMQGGGPFWGPLTGPQRQGPATLWHGTGKVAARGEYRDDRREGTWTFFDEQGRTTAKGPYCEDRRHGQWTVWEGPQRTERQVSYAHGRRIDDVDGLLARLGEQLRRPEYRERYDALWRLSALGGAAVPALIDALETDDAELQRMAAVALGRLGTEARDAVAPLQALAEGPDTTVQLSALDALAAIDADRRNDVHARLFQFGLSDDPAVRRQAVAVLAGQGASVVPLLRRHHGSDLPQCRLALDVFDRMLAGGPHDTPYLGGRVESDSVQLQQWRLINDVEATLELYARHADGPLQARAEQLLHESAERMKPARRFGWGFGNMPFGGFGNPASSGGMM